MAQVGALEIPPELLEAWQKLFAPTSNRRTGSIRKVGYLPSRKRVLELTNKSLLPQVRYLWNGLDDAQRLQWKAAAAVTKMNGWNLFVQDTCYRLKYGIPGLAQPSLLHQYKVGRIEIAAPAEKVVLKQYHPEKYYVSKKMRGDTQLREDVAIYEKFQLPLIIATSYRSALMSTRADYKARMYATIYSSYQGRTIETDVGFDFALETGWTRDSASVLDVLGVARSYDVTIELDGVRGWFEWDNPDMQHTGTNWARDRRCNDVNNELTRVDFQIEASWEEQFLPAKTAFDSVYPTD